MSDPAATSPADPSSSAAAAPSAYRPRATVAAILAAPALDGTCVVAGWIRSFRGSKRVAFIALSDGSCAATLQVVLPGEMPELSRLRPRLTTGASVRVTGRLVASPGAGQAHELHAEQLDVLGDAAADAYPLQKKGHSLEFLRSIAHLRPRSQTFGAVFRIRAALTQATHRFFGTHGFAHVHTPIITTSDCEGAGESFAVHGGPTGQDFFGRPAMLTVSGQLAGEALAYGLGRIYTFGPTFRAENSNTVRHLSEFWMVEPEVAFADLEANIALASAYFHATVAHVLAHCADDVALLAGHHAADLAADLAAAIAQPPARVSYTQAVEILAASGATFERRPTWGEDLQAEHERFLVERYFKRPTVVTDYPRALKAFYMFQNDDHRTVAAMDFLVPRLGELMGGSQREHRLDLLERRIVEGGMNQEAYAWYCDLARYGTVPHAGFGLGFERLVMFCTGMANIRDVVPFPRSPGHAPY